jgi:hypothetical protein
MALSLYSQNWAPINTSEKFCYSTDDQSHIINNVLWVDSIEMIGADSLFHLNKIAKYFEDQYIILNNEPQFLLDDVIVKDNGEWIFMDTAFSEFDQIDTFKILPQANYYESWEFSNDLDAVIANVSTMSIFGQTDSVKTILLSDYSQILLSKNHGIINWRGEFDLIGIEGRDLGLQVPLFKDFYQNISPGDVVCFLINGWEASKGAVELMIKKRINIEEVTRYEDSIILYVEEWTEEHIIYWDGGSSDIKSEYKEIVLKPNGLTESYPNELVFLGIWQDYAWAYGYAITRLEEFKWGGVKKTQIFMEDYYPLAGLFDPCEDGSNEYCPNGDMLLMEYSEKYGFLEYGNQSFEHGGDRIIKGVIDDGDTIGTIYPIEMFVGTNQLSTTSNWLVYPNPAKEFITIKSPKEENTGQYKIYNLNGILLKEGILNNKESNITIKELPKGMYFIKLNIKGELVTKKWIKN